MQAWRAQDSPKSPSSTKKLGSLDSSPQVLRAVLKLKKKGQWKSAQERDVYKEVDITSEPHKRDGTFSLIDLRATLQSRLNNPKADHTYRFNFSTSGGPGNKLVCPQPTRTPNGSLLSAVEFSQPEYMIQPSDTNGNNIIEVHLTVLRRGDTSTRISVDFATTNVAFGDKFYNPVQGTLVFEPGRQAVHFSVEVFDDPAWNVDAAMDVELKYPKVTDSACFNEASYFLGDVARCRVYILNNDRFPSGVKNLEDPFDTLWCFTRHIFGVRPRECYMALFWKIFPAVKLALEEMTTVLLLSTINEEIAYRAHHNNEPSDNFGTKMFSYGIIYVLLLLMVYFADMMSTKLRLRGKVSKALREGAVDRANCLGATGAAIYDAGCTMKIMDSHLDNAVDSFMAVFLVWELSCRVIVSIVFICGIAAYQNEIANGETPLTVTFILVQPFLTIIVDTVILFLSLETAIGLDNDECYTDEGWSSFVENSTYLRFLIHTYKKTDAATKWFQVLHNQFINAKYHVGYHLKHVEWTCNLVPTLGHAFAATVIGSVVVYGHMSVALFVSYMSLVKGFGPLVGNAFEQLFQVLKGYAPVKKLSIYLNMEDIRFETYVAQYQRALALEDFLRSGGGGGAGGQGGGADGEGTGEGGADGRSSGWKFDPECLFVHEIDVAFVDECADEDNVSGSGVRPLFAKLKLCIEPGQMVVLTGPSHSGKRSLLKALSGATHVADGFVYTPPHWRVRYLESHSGPGFFAPGRKKPKKWKRHPGTGSKVAPLVVPPPRDETGTLDWNLRFGMSMEHPDEDVYALLKRLWVSDDLTGSTVEEYCTTKKWQLLDLVGARMSHTDCTLVTIAQALLSSPDFLILSNMLDSLESAVALNVVSVLKELAHEGCVECLATQAARLPPDLRKRRLVIYSTKLSALEGLADSWMLLTEPSMDM